MVSQFLWHPGIASFMEISVKKVYRANGVIPVELMIPEMDEIVKFCQQKGACMVVGKMIGHV